ncbi:MAG: PorP/SprF family type IX secretion system membrane protein [Bacteroidales bacterium]|nr:PorP/SprF family type IX secretion system membrane protein [Candidatus Colimorpha onthohippi]
MLLSSLQVLAQDVHFSQIDINPILYNPAYAGFFEGKARFGINYRSQWGMVSHPYQTFSLSAEAALYRNRYSRSGFNAALIAFRDKAGTLGYGTTAANVILSYYHSLTGDASAYMSASLEVGYGQAGFDDSKAQMMDANQTFHNTTVSYPTVGAGLAWFMQPDDEWVLRIAASARNLNRPNISYLQLDDTHLEMKWNVYARAEWHGWDYVSLLPIVAFQYQRRATEFYAGGDVKWYVEDNHRRHVVLGGGAMVRSLDALILDVFGEYNAFLLAISYDINFSKLAVASKSVGALEIGLVYRLLPVQRRQGALPCPIM